MRDIDQQSVSQTIDAMVAAEPELAWLKQAEAQGDVDWRQVKEIHDRWNYKQSGLGEGAALPVSIAATAAMPGIGTGLTGAMMTAATGSLAGNGAVGLINNRGNLGATLNETLSADGLKSALIAAISAGVSENLDSVWGGETDPATGRIIPHDLSTWEGTGRFAGQLSSQALADAELQSVINGGSLNDNFKQNLRGAVTTVLEASLFNQVGNLGDRYPEFLADGGSGKTVLHALAGGLASQATGGDFRTGAIAAGTNEALINQLDGLVKGDKNLQIAASRITGIVAAGMTGGDVQKGAEIAGNATAYNRQLHGAEQRWLENNAQAFAEAQGISEQEALERLSQQALKDTDYLWRSILAEGNDSAAQAFLATSGQTFTNDLGKQQALFTATGQQLLRPEMFADSADRKFYRDFVQSGVSRELNAGLARELKNSGIKLSEDATELGQLLVDQPNVVLEGLWQAVKNLPQSVVESLVDGYHETGNAIGDGAAVALNKDIANSLSDLYGTDVSTIQRGLLLTRIVGAIGGPKAVSETGKLLGKVIPSKNKAGSNILGEGDTKTTGNPVVDAEKAALDRIAQNPKVPDLSSKAPNTVLNTQAVDGLKRGKLPGTPIGGLGTPREMPVTANPSATAENFVNQIFGGSQINKKPIAGCNGCWRGQTADGAWITYRPSGQASAATSSTTATVEINSPRVNTLNANQAGKGQILKLKFPVKSEVGP